MIGYADKGKTVRMLINRDTADVSYVGRPLALIDYHGRYEAWVKSDTNEFYASSNHLYVMRPLEEGTPFKIFIDKHDPFTMTLPAGSLAVRVKHLRAMFSPSTRTEVVKGSTRNNIRIQVIGPSFKKQYPNWELAALNIGEVSSGAVHEEKRRVRGAYPGTSQSATKAGRRDRAPRRGS